MEKKRILFVDDDPNILDGLRRMLRSMRKEYELCFAEGGSQALEFIAEKSCDIVVSDMRMPGMDGAQLLTEVKKNSPHSIRIMLTGQADDESVMRTVGVVHQFLAKPCDPDKLKDILRRSSALHQIMADGKLKEIISGIDTLPSIPSIYKKLQDKLKDPDVELEEIASIISKDIAMTAKVLQLVNSAFFGLFQKVETPERAVTLLGIDTIKSLVLVVQVFSEIALSDEVYSVDRLWRHSIAVGTLAKKIAMVETGDDNFANEAFFAGILHDIGKLLFISKMGTQYEEVLNVSARDSLTLYEAEKQIFGSTHCEVGAYLIGLWGFQSEIVEAIVFHHKFENYPAQSFTSALAVHVANVMEHAINSDTQAAKQAEFDLDFIKKLGLESKLEQWKQICEEELEMYAGQ